MTAPTDSDAARRDRANASSQECWQQNAELLSRIRELVQESGRLERAVATFRGELTRTGALLAALMMWIDRGLEHATFGTTGSAIRADIQARVDSIEALLAKAGKP